MTHRTQSVTVRSVQELYYFVIYFNENLPRMPFHLDLLHSIKKQACSYNQTPLKSGVSCVVINIVGQINSIRLTATLHSGLLAQLQVDTLPSQPPLR